MVISEIITERATARPPHWLWMLAEGRAVYEFGSFMLARPLLRRLPRGDGHPVVVFPGFLATDGTTAPLRGLLDDLGYDSYAWGMGRNMRFNEEREEEMLGLLDAIFDTHHGDKVSLVGWSLGGVFARELAKVRPEKVRCVVSLGSPIHLPHEHSHARHIYEQVNGPLDPREHERMAKLNVPPPVPTTSIYSKTDGIVSWRGSVQDPHMENPNTENIEIPASHFGLGFNPFTMIAIADRLAQDPENWSPFDRAGFRSFFFKTPKKLWGRSI